ncbi:hypothetical protein EZV62_003142 [Acer yangbiense]|uniref:SGNH hydrolase-type esterase domain-containing protein n=1 Tax=Acer yangbiense TaxID=1000413 RepID=A0A5C7IFX4_9ROSI|nr:hypothetical protein EZV62_003142 [Acer yangbiense]
MARPTSFLFCVMMMIFATTLMNTINGCYGADHQHKLLFVIGDSLFDPGNNQYLMNGSTSPATSYPYGMSMHNHSSGRLSDGLIVPDFIGLFANKKVPPPFLKPGSNFSDGVNFASAGARVLEEHSTGVMNMKAQLSNFDKVAKLIAKKVGDEEAKKLFMRSVYLISLGGNDYFGFNTDNPNATQSQRISYMRMVVANLTNGFKEIYGKGGRKFAIQNVGPLGCYPMIKQMYPELKGSCSSKFLSHAKLHNKALSNALKKLSNKLPGFKYSILDYYYALGDRINNATKYGFKVGKIACCGNGDYNGNNCGGGHDGKEAFKVCSHPDEYVLFDGGHTTMRTNRQLAELLWNGKPNITGPYNLKQLFDLP